MRRIIRYLVKKFPSIGIWMRYFYAVRDICRPTRQTYSQFGEDQAIIKELKNWDAKDSIYVDIGANQPTVLSNTYLLYRNGWHGITVDPNLELIRLHSLFRSRDIQVNVGCGQEASLETFYFDQAPVLSSFSKNDVKNVVKVKLLPILTVDQVLKSFNDKKIGLLSVDTEGFDLKVLKGANETLKRTFLVCVESNTGDAQKEVEEFLAIDFEPLGKYGCNQLFKHR